VTDAAPLLIGYDGSDPARRAVRAAGELFGSRRALVVTVWEPALAYEATVMPGIGVDGMATPPVAADVGDARELEDQLEVRANLIAEDGAELAKSVGLNAEALAVAEETNVAEAIVELARGRRAAAVVVGSRGLTGLRARLEGSTSNAVLKNAPCPVVVVHDD